MVRELWRELPQPMVVDADALQALSGWAVSALAEHAGPRILTPHAGEIRHLMAGVRDIGHAGRTEWEQAAADFARHTVSCVILKGAETLITDGGSSMHNSTGNPGLATAGTGDVLSGIIAALLAQKLPPLDAARLGVWVHGKAGDAAAEALGQLAMTATDVIDHLSGVWQSLRPVPGSGVMA
jgi:NAD(P)H-hydrate epimerase